MAAKKSPKVPAVKPFAFVEDEAEVLTTVRPEQPEKRKHDELVAARSGQAVQQPARIGMGRAGGLPVGRLPQTGPGVIRVLASGARVSLLPSDQEASLRLLGLRAQVGRHYDSKRKADVYRFDEMMRRGASGYDSLRLLPNPTF